MYFEKNSLVMLLLKNLKLRKLYKKLTHKFLGLFRVRKRHRDQLYKLKLPITWKINPIFHIFLLKLYY